MNDSSSSDEAALTGLAIKLKVGQSINLEGILSGDTDDNIFWKSSNTKTAKFSNDGTVTAKGKGTAVISATLGKNTVKITVKVK